jgi:N-acetylneuraminic acid mutarotase
VWQESPSSVGAWTAVSTSNEPTARHEDGFVQLGGKFYLLGGRGDKPVEIYDPATNQWSQGATPPLELHHFQAFVYEGKIAVVGGYSGICCATEFGVSHLYYYDPASDSWSQGAEIPAARRRGSGGSVLYQGKFYWVGGLDGGHGDPATSYPWFDVYDPVSGQWATLPDAPRPRGHFQAAVVGDKLYVAGGRDGSDPSIFNATIAEVDVYDFATGQWATLPTSANLPTPRAGTTTAVLGSEIIVIGGESPLQGEAHAQVEAFDTRSQTWRTLAPLQQGRHGTQVAVCNEGLYIVAGSANRGGGPEITQLEQFFFGEARPCVAETRPSAPGVRINAGGGELLGKDGRLWQADSYFSGGSAYTGAGVVGNTEDSDLYLSERFGEFSYDVAVSSGCYQIELHFAEIFWAEPNKRLFNVLIEGEMVLQNYDIYATAGSQYRAVVERKQAEVTDGTLNFAFQSVVENAKVSAIAITPLADCDVPNQAVYLPLVLRR